MASKLPPLGERSRLMRRIIWTGVIVGIVAIAAVVAFVGLSTERRRQRQTARPARARPPPKSPARRRRPSPSSRRWPITSRRSSARTTPATAPPPSCPRAQGLCSAARGDRQNRKAFLIGPSSYEYQLWVFLKKDGTAWKVESTLPVKPETVNAPGAPWPLEKGAKVVVGGTGTCLNVRAAPGIKEAAVDCIADGTVIVLEEGPVEMDGYQWWRPQGRSGWVAGDWLRYADESATPAPAAPSPTPAG